MIDPLSALPGITPGFAGGEVQGLLTMGAAVLGAVIGSFLGAVLVRMPAGRSVIIRRSACDGCGKRLTIIELMPVLSWILQKGKCRNCGGAIGLGQLTCELGGAAVGLGAVLLAPDELVLAAMILGWQLLLLALLDLKHLWLPRRLTGWLAASGAMVVGVKAWAEHDMTPVFAAATGAVVGYGMLWLIARLYLKARGRDGMGAGDPPLLGAIGLWVGPLGVVEVMLGASIVGIVAAIVMLVSKRKIDSETALPLGTCLAATAWPIFLLQGLG